MFKGIDLFSDTVTQPTAAMKIAMFAAELGDEQRGEDPTTRRLEEMVAELLGCEAAMFFPSATMANEIALRLLGDPGDELLAAENCHLFFAEAGGPAIHAGLMTRPVRTVTGVFSATDLRAIYRWMSGAHYPISKIISIENTTNMGGGIVWDLATLNDVLLTAKELRLKAHLDGSRLFNAAIKMNVPPATLTAHFDTVTICLSKGLGCPVGALLAFRQYDYAKVRRLKQLFGGAMRQSGILAAAGIYALQHHVERLADDHANAEWLAARLAAEVPSIRVARHANTTNMVFFEWCGTALTATQFNDTCIHKGLRFTPVGGSRFRAVTHLDITRQNIDDAVEILKQIV